MVNPTIKRIYHRVDTTNVIECVNTVDWTPRDNIDLPVLWGIVKSNMLNIESGYVSHGN